MSDVRSFHVARYAVLVTVATLQASRSHQYLPDHFMYRPAPTEPRDVKTESGMKCRPEQGVSWATAAGCSGATHRLGVGTAAAPPQSRAAGAGER